jgi:hypothetical protein
LISTCGFFKPSGAFCAEDNGTCAASKAAAMMQVAAALELTVIR